MLYNDEINLRKTATADLDYVIRTEQDSDNAPFIMQWPREKHEAAIHSADHLHLIVEHRHSGRRIGYVILAGLENPHNSIELVRLTVASKGQGYGKSVLKLLRHWAFHEQRAHRLWLDVKEHNHRARHVYESVGFVVEGKLRECLRCGDSYESLIVMSMLATD